MSRRIISLVILILILSVIYQTNLIIDTDVAYYMLFAKRIWLGQDSLSNAAPFYFYLNGPFQYLLYIIPTAIALFTPLSEEIAAKLYIYLIAGLSLAYLVSFVRHYRAVKGANLDYLVPIFAFFAFLFPIDSFGQRDNLFLLLFFPYVLSVVDRVQNLGWKPGSSLWLAATAVPAVLIKPFFIIPWLALESFAMLATRTPAIAFTRLNAMMVVANGILYVSIAAMVTIVGWEHFIEGARIRYASTNWSSYPEMLFRKLSLLWVAAVVGYAAYRWAWSNRPGMPRRGPWGGPDVLFVAFLSTIVEVVAQHKGNDYHWYPVVIFATLGLAWSFCELRQFREKTEMPRLKASVVGVGLLCALFAAAITYRTAIYTRNYWDARKSLVEAAAILNQAANGGAFFSIFAFGVYPTFPLALETGLFHAHRYYSLYYLDGYYPAEGEEKTEAGKRKIDTLVKIFLEDFERWKPTALIRVNAPKNIDKLLADPRLRPIFDRYEPYKTLGRATFYRLAPAS